MFELGTLHLHHGERDREVEDALRLRRLLEATPMTSGGTPATRPPAAATPRSGLRVSPSAER